jgi:hypothetical protein
MKNLKMKNGLGNFRTESVLNYINKLPRKFENYILKKEDKIYLTITSIVK